MKMGTILAAGLISAAGLWAQDIGVGIGVGRGGGASAFGEHFQQVVTLAAPGPQGVQQNFFFRSDAVSRQTVTGRPVSGTEEQNSTQTLGDGTVITNSSTGRFYRDSAGRTRTEGSEGRVTIYDPVARVSVILMAEGKRARVMPMPEIERKMGSANKLQGPVIMKDFTYTTTAGTTTATGTVAAGARAGRFEASAENAKENAQKEDLGVESLNGILATHTRSTLTIPQGQIGNDRDIHVVNERWFSDDLQMLVKTVNSDPRFGQNTYEFTNISRDEPDPSLFQIPSDYTVIDLGAIRSDK